ncbi:MAG: hypothetical protein K8R92_03040 [Planctomycetes bacterium]|nr:hypothetical protein [Planctomycetota bacterium]
MILSVLVALLVLLIAYWWSNQGVFDAFIHFVCVVIAGALAFALWEPVTVGFLLKGGGFDAYAWGVSLGGIFLVALFGLRFVFDSLTPKRPKLPRWANLSFGGVLGLLSGTLTMGITLIAVGHLSTTTELLGYYGWVRSPESQGRPMQSDPNSPPSLAMAFTQGFYDFLSLGSFSPLMGDATLASHRPGIAADGGSLFRDSLRGGKGNSTLSPTGFAFTGAYFDPKYVLRDGTVGAYAVLLSFKPESFDHEGSFSLSASQARLIAPTAEGAIAEFPIEFSQEKKTDAGRSMIRYEFKTDSSYATLEDGKAEGSICLVFPAKPFLSANPPVKPTMLSIKGLRIALPKLDPDALALGRAVENAGASVQIPPDETAPAIPADELEMNSSISGMLLSKNGLPGTLQEANGSIFTGAATHVTKNALAKGDVRSIAQDQGQKIVKLKISKDSVADLYNVDKTRKVAQKVGMGGVPMLVDTKGNLYEPFGYIWVNTLNDEWEIYLEPPNDGFTVKQFLRGENSGYIDVLYRLPLGVEISMAILRDPKQPLTSAKVLGTASLKIEGK